MLLTLRSASFPSACRCICRHVRRPFTVFGRTSPLGRSRGCRAIPVVQANGGERQGTPLDVSLHERGMRIGQDGLEDRVEFIRFINLQELDARLQTKVHRSLER